MGGEEVEGGEAGRGAGGGNPPLPKKSPRLK